MVIARLRGIQQRRWRIAIHHHFAGNHAQITLAGLVEKHLHRMRVHGAVNHRRGGANAQALIEKQLRNFTRMIDIGKLLLGRKGVAVQPIDQLLAIGTDDLRLRVVHVQVDEARQDQGIGVSGDRRPGFERILQSGICAERLDAPVLNHHQRVSFVMHRCIAAHQERIVAKGEGGTAQCEAGHGLRNYFLRHQSGNLREKLLFVIGLHDRAAVAVFHRRHILRQRQQNRHLGRIRR